MLCEKIFSGHSKRFFQKSLDTVTVAEFTINKSFLFKRVNPMEKNLTTGSVLKNVLYFSLPYLLSYFLQTLYGMADLFIIGKFEETIAESTAVSIGSQVMHMLTVMIVGLAMGTTVGIGQAIGANDKKSAAKDVGNTTVLFSVLSLVLTAVLLLLTRPIVHIMKTPQQAVEGTVSYLTVCFIGIPFITAYNVLSAIFRGMGDSKSPMCFIAVACAFNIGLDFLFMGVFKMGPVGAALGTTLSQAVSVIVSLAVIIKRKVIGVQKSDFRPERPIMGKIMKIGVPIAVQDGLIQIAFIVITVIANKRGLTDSTAVGIVEKIISFLFLVPSSLLSTVSALGAQNIGAGKKERAVQTLGYACMIAAGFGLTVSLLVQFVAEPLVGLFIDDPAVISAGGQYLCGYVLDCFFAGIHFSFSGYFCACGKSGISFLHNIIAIVLVRIPGAYLMSKMFADNLLPMGLATACGSLVSVIICVIAFSVIEKREKRGKVENGYA